MKENINILIEKKENIKDEVFKKEILSNGNVKYFEDNKIYNIKCNNQKLTKIGNYKCFDIKGKNILFF